jgi:transcriptional regulator of acetoin/glycerol metabolism
MLIGKRTSSGFEDGPGFDKCFDPVPAIFTANAGVFELDDDAEIESGVDGKTLKEAERLHILATLKRTGWVLSGPRGAAVRLGINRSTLQFRMKKLGIERPSISAAASVA